MVVTDKKKCMRCSSNKLITDMYSAEIFCSKCGFVVPEKLQRLDQEWRAFTGDEFNNIARTGRPTSLAIHDMGLATVISTSNRDALSRPLKQTMRYEIRRLRNLDNRSQIHSQSDINKREAFTILETLKEKLNLPDHISERAAYIYRKVLEKNIVRGRTVQGMITASIYAACRENDTNRSIHDFQKASNVNRKVISRDYRTLVRELNLKISVLDPLKCVSRIANNLGLGEKTKRHAIELLKAAELSGIIAGKDPRSMAACALYLAGIKCGEPHTQMQVASVAHVTEVTVRNRCKEFSKVIEIEW